MTKVHQARARGLQALVAWACCSGLGVDLPFFDPTWDGMTVHTERALDSTEAWAFLGCFDDDVFFFFTVSVASSVFSVLFAASFAAVALSAVGSEAEFDEIFALAVRAGQRVRDWHAVILKQPTTKSCLPILGGASIPVGRLEVANKRL
jgi:hypothetical protein